MINICTAYTKDHRRCRLEKVGEKTCTIHRNYYKDWFIKHPVVAYGEHIKGRKLKELVYQLRNHITVTEKMIKEWESSPGMLHADNYEFLILHANINPLWSQGLLKSVLFNIIHNYDWCDRLSSILTSPEVCNEIFKDLLHLYEWGFDLSWSTLFYPSNWRMVMYSDAFVDIYNDAIEKHKKSPQLIFNLKNFVWPFIKILKLYHRHILRDHVGIFKEELMMVCWHPSKIEGWIKSGGHALVDNMMGI